MGNDRRMRDEHNDRTMVERVDPLMGSVLDNRYRIDFRLAAGGFGAIYRATHIESGEQFALKVLHGDLATSDARVIARFRREGATLEQLRDPHTISAFELGEAPDGSLYIVMELLHGESLYEQFRSKGPLPWRRVVSIGRQVCSSLSEAHALGIIHRDLKPANIHLENRGGNPDFVKVLDFGIAKIMRESDLDSTELTQAGQMIGTFDYMAPEQMVGGQCTAATDIYTLGIVLYEMVTGQRPFADAASPTAMLAALLTQDPPALDVPGAPSDLDRILRRCLEREPQNRYADVDELAADLDRLLQPVGEARTLKLNTPAPVLCDEETVVAQPRPRRGSQPHPMKRDEPAVTVEGRSRRGSEPPPRGTVERARRDSSVPVRRDGAGEARPKRDSSPPNANIIRRHDSQPVPLVKPPDPNAWQSLQLPKRDRDSQAVPLVRHDNRDSQPVPVVRGDHRDSQPVPRNSPLPAHVAPPSHVPLAPQQPLATPPPAYPAGSYPAIESPYGPASYPLPPTPTPQPFAPHASAIPHAPIVDRGSAPVIDPSWQASYPQRAGLDSQAYDMAGVQSRDVVVRRVVWTIALVLGVILVLVVASRL